MNDITRTSKDKVYAKVMESCAECGMSVEVGEYHPYAACLMYKACHTSATVRANLAAVRASAHEPTPQPSNTLSSYGPWSIAQLAFLVENVANCLDHGTSAAACSAELRSIVQQMRTPKGAENEPPAVPSVEPIARVINNNQPGWTNIVETAPNVTLFLGDPLYSRESVMKLAAALAGAIHRAAQPPGALAAAVWEVMDDSAEDAQTGEVTVDAANWQLLTQALWDCGGRWQERLRNFGWEPPTPTKETVPADPDEETPCPKREDGIHCECWYGGNPCCGCGREDILDGQMKPPCSASGEGSAP